MLTHEVRWFVAEPVALAELQRFAAGGGLEQREDLYLLGTGPTRGVKRRGGAILEHKQRVASFEIALREPALHLSVERWRKTLPEEGTVEGAAEGAWARVGKRRALRMLGPCRVELTELRLELPGRPPIAAQTLAVETGDRSDAPRVLGEVAGELLRSWPELELRYRGAPCLGYPAWLASL